MANKISSEDFFGKVGKASIMEKLLKETEFKCDFNSDTGVVTISFKCTGVNVLAEKLHIMKGIKGDIEQNGIREILKEMLLKEIDYQTKR